MSKLDSIRQSKERGPVIVKADRELFHIFVEQVRLIFKNLLKPLKWKAFLMHDLILLTDIPSKVKKASVKYGSNIFSSSGIGGHIN